MVVRPLVRPLVRPSGSPGFAGWAGSPRVLVASGGVNGSNIPAWAIDADLAVDYTTGATYGTGDVSGMFPPSTDTHAQTIYAPDTLGFYQPYAANVPVLTNLGLQTVPTRTNSIRNNSNAGAAAGTPGTLPTNWAWNGSGTLTTSVVGTGTQDGLPYIDLRLSGTTSTTGVDLRIETITGVAASNAQTWAGSAFVALVGGSTSNVTSVTFSANQRDAGGSFLSQLTFVGNFLSSLSASLARFSGAVTTNNASIAYLSPQFTLSFSSGVTIDITLRIGATQQEVGAFASPPILTTSAAVTVNGNQQVISGLGTQLATGVAGLVQVNNLQVGDVNNGRVIEFNDGTTSNRIRLFRNATTTFLGVTVGGIAQTNVTDSAVPAGVSTYAFAAASGFSAMRIVGRSAVANASPSYPATTALNIGGQGFDATVNNYQFARKLAFDFLTPSDDPAIKFSYWYNQAVLAASS